ncbi:hypothetical protein BZA77DRAFT_352069 [Pyronema omphalodes]|nr:hypothetical protein BZA77DRAFT_352069 [Pyronema omphalodes]
MASFFPRPTTPAFRPGQSQPSTPKRFGLKKDIAVLPDEVPEIPNLEDIQRVMESDVKNLRTPSKKTSFWKANHDGGSSPQKTPSRVRGLSKQVKSRLSLKGESLQLEPNKPLGAGALTGGMCPEPTKHQLIAHDVVVAMKLGEGQEMLKSPSIGQRVRTVSTRSSFAQKGKNRLSDPYSADGLFRSTTPQDEIPPVPPIPARFRSSAASSFQQASGYSQAMDSNASSFDLQRSFNDFRISDSDEAHLLGDIDGMTTGTRERKFSDATATQSIRTTQTVRNVVTNQTNQTSQTTDSAPSARPCLIDIVSDEPRPEFVSVVYVDGYQPFSVGDPNLEHANPFAFIHESTMRDAMYLTPGVPAETDISIKRLETFDDDIHRLEAEAMKKYRAEQKEKRRLEMEKKGLAQGEIKLPQEPEKKKKKTLIHFDKKELSKKISRKWQRYVTMNREKRTLCEELDERWETLIKRTEEYQMHLKLVDREYNIVASSFPKTTLIRDCGKSLIDAKGKYQKFKGYVLGRTRMFYNCDWEFDHPDFETRRINDVYYNVLPPHVIARRRAERALARLERDNPGSKEVIEAKAHLEALEAKKPKRNYVWPDLGPTEPTEETHSEEPDESEERKASVEPKSRSALAAEVAPPPMETAIPPIKSMPPPKQDPRKVIQSWF